MRKDCLIHRWTSGLGDCSVIKKKERIVLKEYYLRPLKLEYDEWTNLKNMTFYKLNRDYQCIQVFFIRLLINDAGFNDY